MEERFSVKLVTDNFVELYRGLFLDSASAQAAAKSYRELGYDTEIILIRFEKDSAHG